MRNKMLMNHTAADDRERSEGSQQPRHLVPVPPSCFLSHGSLSSVSHGGSLLSHGLLSHGPLPLVSFLSHGHIPVMAVRLLLREIMTRDRLDKGTVHQHLRHKDPGHPFLTLTTTTPSFPSL